MRELIDTFDQRFLRLKRRTSTLLENASDDELYSVRTAEGKAVGELILRSAGAVEQVIGGITRRLWDDPFEWTLTERMQTTDLILAYIDEVEASRMKGFLFFRSDEDLTKSLPAPVVMKTLSEVLGEALIRAESLLAEAESLLSSKPN